LRTSRFGEKMGGQKKRKYPKTCCHKKLVFELGKQWDVSVAVRGQGTGKKGGRWGGRQVGGECVDLNLNKEKHKEQVKPLDGVQLWGITGILKGGITCRQLGGHGGKKTLLKVVGHNRKNKREKIGQNAHSKILLLVLFQSRKCPEGIREFCRELEYRPYLSENGPREIGGHQVYRRRSKLKKTTSKEGGRLKQSRGN